MSRHAAGATVDGVALVLGAQGGQVDLFVAAVRDDNTGAELTVVDHGDRVEVRACRRLQVTVRTLRWHTGGDEGIHDLRSMILSVRGNVTAEADRLVVTSPYASPPAARAAT